MKYISCLVFILISNAVFGQYTLDRQIRNDAFFKTVDTGPNGCSINYVYYEQQDRYEINGARMDCYRLQEQIKDSLRAKFSDQELFDIARYSQIPFYRIAAFDLYSQTDYSKDEVIQFLKRGKIPSRLFSSQTANDSAAQRYIPMPNSMEPQWEPITFKLLEFIDPTATRRVEKKSAVGYTLINVPKYPNSKTLDLESFVALQTYLRYYCEDRLTGYAWTNVAKPGEKKPVMPTFYMLHPELDFGTIDLGYLDSRKTDFELHSTIKVINNTSKPITVTGQASGHTMCLQGRYVIPPNKEMMIEFKSLVTLNQPQINRSITLTNVETGDAQMFKFKAKFINTKT